MASKSITSKVILTPEFRVAFPNIFQPNDKNKYGLTMLFDKQNFNAAPFQEIIKEVLEQVQTVVYKGQPIPPSVRRSPIKDGDVPNSENKIHFPGFYFAGTTTLYQPGIVDHALQPIINQGEFYPGCYARAKVHAYWYDVDGNKGIGFSIGNIQKTRDGERMGGGRAATEDFDVFIDTVAGVDGTAQSIDNIMDIPL